MAKLVSWLKSKAADLIDPGYKERWNTQVAHIERAVFQKKDAFDLRSEARAVDALPEQVAPLARAVYERAVERAWADGCVSQGEREALSRVATLLQISPDEARQLTVEAGVGQFRSALADTFRDGRLDPAEQQKLVSVAQSIGLPIGQLVRQFFSREGEAFLRSLFASMVHDGQLDTKEWAVLVDATAALGLSRHDLTAAIRPQAEQFVEHVLADAQADARLSTDERQTLEWLLINVIVSDTFKTYVRSHVDRLALLTDIAAGKLPSLDMHFDGRRSGEIVHYVGAVVYHQLRNRASGPSFDEHHGQLVITDYRIVFTAPTKTFDVKHTKVVALIDQRNGFEARSSGKGGGFYSFATDVDLPRGIMRAAVGRANQVIVAKPDDADSRYIPRDVRQRVWQRYGGRCAECGASQYLEFDHIVPVAKGGSNSDLNVQLLCRGCNAKKSDAI